jgi:PKD repeat protein
MKQFLLLFLLLIFSFSGFCQLEFIENKGQWDVAYSYRAKLNCGDFWLKGNEVAFVLSDFGGMGTHNHGHSGDIFRAKDHCYKMEFLRAGLATRFKAEGKKESYHNYYIGKDPVHWKSGVNLFESIRHQNLYPGIDLIWKEENGQLKYEFHLEAGANPDQIQTRYSGLDGISLENEQLELKTSLGTIIEKKPVAFQNGPQGKLIVNCRFKRINAQTIGFEFPDGYDQRLPLIIDPVLVFSTFSGSRADNWGFSATYGENGTAYAGGIALGPRFPLTTGAFQSIYGGDSIVFNNRYSTFDIGILKFNASGTQLLFATYLGGLEAEVPSSLVVDNQNNLIVFGASGSSNYPTSANAFDNTYNGGTDVSPYGPGQSIVRFRAGSDLVITKFSQNGSQLLGSTYLGGAQNDGLLTLLSAGNSPLVKNYGDSFRGEVTVDSLNRIYIASNTSSGNFPVAAPLQASKSGGVDAVCARLNPNLSALEFSTFLGGNQDDAAFSLQINLQNQVYLTGGTASSNFPSNTGTIQPTFGGQVDGFISRFTPGAGIASLRSTFLGTTGYDQSFFVQLDKNQRVYLFGQTKGSWPISSNVFSNPNSGQFIHCLSPNLDSTKFSTSFGTGSLNPNIAPTAFLVDDCGRIYCSGWGGVINNSGDYDNDQTAGMPTTPDALIKTSDGSDFYMMVLERNAKSLAFATFFGDTINNGSEHVDGGTSRFDKKGVVYQSVCAGCGGTSTFPTTPGVVSNVNRASCNNAIFKYDFSFVKARFQPSAIQGCAPLNLIFNNLSLNGQVYRWDFQDGTSYDTTSDEVAHTFVNAGQYNVKLVAFNPDACPTIDSAFVPITVQKAPDLPGDSIAFCQPGQTLNFQALPSGPFTYQWTPNTYLNNTATATPSILSPSQSVVYRARVRTSFGCESTNTYKLTNGILRSEAEADTLAGCKPLRIRFTNKSFQSERSTWFWGNGDSTVIDSLVFHHLFESAGLFQVVLQAKNDTTCDKIKTDTLWVRVFDLPNFSDTLQYYCNNQAIALQAATNQGISYSWSPGQVLQDSTLAIPLLGNPIHQDFTLSIKDSNGCKAKGLVKLRNGILKAKIQSDTLALCRPGTFTFSDQSTRAKIKTWFWENGDSTVLDTNLISRTIDSAGIFTIRFRAENDSSCLKSDWDSLKIQVYEHPVFADTVYRICQDGPISLFPSQNSGIVFSWSPGQELSDSTLQNPSILNPVPKTFSLRIKDEKGCFWSAQTQLKEGRLKANFSLNPPGICAPGSLTADNQSFNAISSLWYFGGDSILVSGSGPSPTYAIDSAGLKTIRLKVKNDTTCFNEASVEKSIVFGGIPFISKQSFLFCPGDTVTASGIQQDGYQYFWPPNSLVLSNGSAAQFLTVTDSLQVILNLRDSLNCPGSQIFSFRPDKPNADFVFASLADTCQDVLHYRFISKSMEGIQSEWIFNNQSLGIKDTLEYVFPQRATYAMTLIQNRQSCKDTATKNILVNDKKVILSADFDAQSEALGCNTLPVINLENKSIGARSYLWKWKDSQSDKAIPEIRATEKGELPIVLEVINGECKVQTTRIIDVQPIVPPNLITLNGDGKNETFNIRHLPAGSQVQIRNRWGELLYESNNYQGNWFPKGIEETVFYLLKLPNGKECNGWIQMVK